MSYGDPSTPALPPPGWYPDPTNGALERWWSGENWTEHVRELPTTLIADSDIPLYASVVAPEPEYTPVVAPPTGYGASSPTAATGYGAYSPTADGGYTAMGSYSAGAGSHWQQDVSSPNTVGVWLVATYPLIYAGLMVATSTLFSAGTVAYFRLGLASGMAIAITLGAVVSDHAVLRNRGLPAPSRAWILLTGIAYLIARRFALKRSGITHNAPGLIFLASTVLAGAIITYAVPTAFGTSPGGLPVSGAVSDSQAILNLQPQLKEYLETQSPNTWTITCPEDQDISVEGTVFTCSGTSSVGERALISIEVTGDQSFIVTKADRVG